MHNKPQRPIFFSQNVVKVGYRRTHGLGLRYQFPLTRNRRPIYSMQK